MDLLDASEQMSSERLRDLRVTSPSFFYDKNLKLAEWKSRFKKKFNREPRYTDAYAYDMTFLIYYASKSLESLPANMDNWREKLFAVNFEGITGPVKFDQDRDLQYMMKTCLFKNHELTPE
jgi:ABC-type branched-subunit amino acid transport system substrate-binding protein